MADREGRAAHADIAEACLAGGARLHGASGLRGEIAVLPINLVFLALSGSIFWGRRKSPIRSR
ncbi:MAG: hypothetical protein P4M07_03000 [Xanthobacteraceae bacterium]|nr:hypothetical protein [Xanthobacteraceae bacterium]